MGIVWGRIEQKQEKRESEYHGWQTERSEGARRRSGQLKTVGRGNLKGRTSLLKE